jgi:single-strand DNA-binding protein
MNQGKIRYLNKVTIVGAIIRDPELRHTTADVPVANFRIASSRSNDSNPGSGREETCYVGIVAWQELAEVCAEKLRKGDVVQINGELKSRIRMEDNRTRRSYVEIRANRIQFINQNGEIESLGGDDGAVAEMPLQEISGDRPEEPVAVMSSEDGDSNYNNYNYDYEENIL